MKGRSGGFFLFGKYDMIGTKRKETYRPIHLNQKRQNIYRWLKIYFRPVAKGFDA